MSYILDALKKAAEQRELQAPGVRRLVAPTPTRGSAQSAWTPRVAITLAIGAIAAIALAIVSLRPAPVAAPVTPTEAARPSPVASVTEAPKPAAVVAAPSETSRPPLAVAPMTGAPKRAAPTPTRAETTKPAAVAPPSEATRPPARAEGPRAPARFEPPPAAAAITPSAQRFQTLPVAPGLLRRFVNPEDPEGPPLVDVPVKLKLEVLVYSDVAAERMVFINGRKYKQGDTVAERARIEEIQPDAVVLSEEGRRFTLRH